MKRIYSIFLVVFIISISCDNDRKLKQKQWEEIQFNSEGKEIESRVYRFQNYDKSGLILLDSIIYPDNQGYSVSKYKRGLLMKQIFFFSEKNNEQKLFHYDEKRRMVNFETINEFGDTIFYKCKYSIQENISLTTIYEEDTIVGFVERIMEDSLLLNERYYVNSKRDSLKESIIYEYKDREILSEVRIINKDRFMDSTVIKYVSGNINERYFYSKIRNEQYNLELREKYFHDDNILVELIKYSNEGIKISRHIGHILYW